MARRNMYALASKPFKTLKKYQSRNLIRVLSYIVLNCLLRGREWEQGGELAIQIEPPPLCTSKQLSTKATSQGCHGEM